MGSNKVGLAKVLSLYIWIPHFSPHKEFPCWACTYCCQRWSLFRGLSRIAIAVILCQYATYWWWKVLQYIGRGLLLWQVGLIANIKLHFFFKYQWFTYQYLQDLTMKMAKIKSKGRTKNKQTIYYYFFIWPSPRLFKKGLRLDWEPLNQVTVALFVK